MSRRFILGTVQFGLQYGINNAAGKPSEQNVFDILELAHKHGIEQLDSADAYGDAQQIIGSFIGRTSKKFKVNSKFHVQGEKSIPEQLNQTLKQLQLQSLNVYFFHKFDDLHAAPAALNTLNDLKKQKLIYGTGVSIYTNEEFKTCIDKDGIDVIQLPFNMLDNFSRRGALIKKAKERGKIVQVRSIFLQGLFFMEPLSYPEKLKPLSRYMERLKEIAQEAEVSIYDLAINYVLKKKEIDQLIIGVDSKEQLEKNLAINNNKVSEDLIAEVDKISVKEDLLLYPYNW